MEMRLINIFKNILLRMGVITNYIVKKFDNGPWHGKVWYDGTLEAYTNADWIIVHNLAITSRYGRGYFSYFPGDKSTDHLAFDFGNIGYSFINPPHVRIKPVCYNGLLGICVNNITKNGYRIFIHDTLSHSLGPIRGSVHVIGRWK